VDGVDAVGDVAAGLVDAGPAACRDAVAVPVAVPVARRARAGEPGVPQCFAPVFVVLVPTLLASLPLARQPPYVARLAGV